VIYSNFHINTTVVCYRLQSHCTNLEIAAFYSSQPLVLVTSQLYFYTQWHAFSIFA